MEIISLIALFAVIALSCFSKVNPGLLALGLAWLLGFYGAHMSITQIATGFPLYMFLVLIGVTYLFGIAKYNGTLEKVAQGLLTLVKHNPIQAPILFFLIAAFLSTIGAGNIGAVALLAPIAMAVAYETGIGAFFMTIILICGANAGAFSPFSLTGIIANGLIQKVNLTMHPWRDVFLPNFLTQSLLAAICFSILYMRYKQHPSKQHSLRMTEVVLTSWNPSQRNTLGAIIILIIGSVIFKADIGFLSISLTSVLVLLNAHDSKEAMKHIPWDVILMVCGINTLIVVLENLGGLNLLTDGLANISTPQTVTGITALFTGIMSAFSSSSGVVLPTFIPLVPEIIAKIGGGDPKAIVASINVGAHLVDISPLSSLGAICVASALNENKEKLFRHLLGFGLSMALAGAVLCYLLF